MIRTKDFECFHCGARYNDYPYEETCPQTIPCGCGKEAEWTFQRMNHIHRSISSLYGKPDPRTGETYDSYEDKNRDFRARGITEGDIEKYDDIQNDIAEKVAAQEATSRDPGTIVADSLEEIMDKINNDAVDRRATGSLTGRAGQDPETGLIDSWRGF